MVWAIICLNSPFDGLGSDGIEFKKGLNPPARDSADAVTPPNRRQDIVRWFLDDDDRDRLVQPEREHLTREELWHECAEECGGWRQFQDLNPLCIFE